MNLRNIFQSKFVRNVIVVASGTAGAQVIGMAFSPFITRLYGPEAFGILGTFTAVLAILTPIAALTYPISIVLPKSDKHAKGLASLSMRLALMISLISFFVLFIGHDWLIRILSLDAIKAFVYLIPIALLLSAYQQIITQWLIRKKQFKVTARVAVFQALIVNVAKTGLGLLNPTSMMLVAVTVIGLLINGFLLKSGIKGKNDDLTRSKVNSGKMRVLASKYQDFPMYRAPQVLLNALSQSLPVLMLASLFGPASAGFYSIGMTVLGIPVTLIGQSVANVFLPKIAEAKNNNNDLFKLIYQSTLMLAVIGFIPFLIVIIFGPWLFSFVFGDAWGGAGEYAQWIATMTYFMLISRVAIVSIPVLNLQKEFLIFEIISIMIRASSLYLGISLSEEDLLGVAIFSLSSVFIYIMIVIYVIYISHKYCVK